MAEFARRSRINRHRTETDSFGPIAVAADRYWGAQTERSRQNFRIGGERMPLPIIHALASSSAPRPSQPRARPARSAPRDAIIRAAREVIDGKLDDHFPLVVWQTGSGTQTNMNVNEVIANRAIELLGGELGAKKPVHPNDHVNMSQSSNDTFPTAMHVAAASALALASRAQRARRALRKKAKWSPIVKIGRTHTQDATPLTLGQEFSGYAAQVERHRAAARCAQRSLSAGAGRHRRRHRPQCETEIRAAFARHVASPNCPSPAPPTNSRRSPPTTPMCSRTARSIRPRPPVQDRQRHPLARIGPASGLGELILPENEPGSSIMPGKVNPTQCEAMTMVCCQVFGNHTAITIAGSQGHFELNVYKPVLAYCMMRSIQLLADVARSFTDIASREFAPTKSGFAN